MRQEKLGFGIIIRVFISLLPIIFELSIVATVMCAYNIVLSFVVFGPLTAIVSSLASVCIAMLLGGAVGSGGELAGLVLALQSIFAAFGCIWGLLYKRKFSLGLYLSSLGILLPQFIYIRYQANMLGVSVTQCIVPSTEEISNLLMPVQNSGIKLSTFEITEISNFVHYFVSLLVPSVFIIASLALAYVFMWCVTRQLRRLPLGIQHSFSTIRLPKTMIVVALLDVLLLAVAEPLNFNEFVTAVLNNMFVVMFLVCAFAGLSFIEYYLRKRLKFGFLRALIYVFAIIRLPIVLIAVSLIPCVDSFFNFRKINNINSVKEGAPVETEK